MNERLPGWLDGLSGDDALAGELGIIWLDHERRAELHRRATGALAELEGNPEWNARGLARLARCVPLALAPDRNKRLSARTSSTALFFDPERPDHVSLSLAAPMSPLTWAEAPATREGLEALFARYFVAEASPVARLPKRFRTMVSFGDADREQLEQALGEGQALLDDASWYSAHLEDPWLGRGPMSTFALMAHLRDVRREDGHRFASVSYRTLFSKSVLTLELQPFGIRVIELRYAPAPDASGVRWVNEMFRSRFPEDLPADLIGASVLQGGHMTLSEIDEQEARGEIDDWSIASRIALAPAEPVSAMALRAYIERFDGDEERLGFLANIAANWGDRAALFEIAARTAGSVLSESIFTKMAPQPAQAEDEDEGEEDEEEDDE